MDVSKLLEILDYLDEDDHNKPINVDDLYAKIFGGLPDDSSKVRENLKHFNTLYYLFVFINFTLADFRSAWVLTVITVQW
jgi:hypothetical protein